MADVMVHMRQSGLQRSVQGHATESERGLERRGPASLFSLTLRDFFTTNPFELMRRFHVDINRFLESTSWSTSLWSPSIAISEKDGHIKVCAELPGLSRDDVRVELTQDKLTISGERKREIYRSERFCRSFMRTIPIHNETQVEKVTATFENEILTVFVPVSSSAQSHRLSARVWVDLEIAETLN
jgi:HSP20 family molecular chaperone IbpA